VGGVKKAALFDRYRSFRLRGLATENLSIRHGGHTHDGALAEEYAVLSTTLVVVEVL